MSSQVAIGFERDIARQLALMIQTWGYNCSENDPFPDVVCRFYMLYERVPLPAPRELKLSSGFRCPPDKQRGLWEFRVRSRAGASIKPFLSRQSKRIDYQDGMLLDWGILHFHIDDQFESDGYVKRSADVLFAIVRDDAIYGIGFWPHNSWSKREALQIAHDNWPELIQHSRISGNIALTAPKTDSDHEKLRKSKVNSVVELQPGVQYLGPGGMQTSSGHSAIAMMKMIHLRKSLRRLERLADIPLAANLHEPKQPVTARMEIDRVLAEDRDGNVIAQIRF